ncbi:MULTISPECIES: exodeoxyribonuclease III [unclassified Saccharibacter]|uniref:exodeoxyribonuclease III n=1 Tax=unclassified Saccharibacter TaxID=2648722 RepID=UPI00132C28D8|nr:MULTISPECIES: exodeoxyribonuclease III [unclassified Saccharibacter]MXV36288.1 exodeoxyribonuclease III [Saccharibacter sp. EH611]MXV57148.1 exodeoxyribonuclease III [Saccharibacter sp. EH70]MXV66492.1 exodeoxyribonuclease III [Saccharibacter sp. EH60]
MRLITWNMNSLRLRLPLLQRLAEKYSPDVMCVQETKVPDPLFPKEALAELGFTHQFYKGMKSYNGVAILSRLPLRLREDTPRWCERDDCRHIAAFVETESGPVQIHNFYVPAGGDIPDPDKNDKFAHKLSFVDEATQWFRKNPPTRSILVGDLNIAPYEHDVWSHKQLLKIVSHTPAETSRLQDWCHAGFQDAMRHLIPEPEKLYTWWSYRNRDWKKSNRGRRLDHIWLTADILPSLQNITVLKEARDWERPSDHVPVMIDISF